MRRSSLLLATLVLLLTGTAARTEAPPPQEDTAPSSSAVDREALFKHFEETLTGVKFAGRFTIVGKDNGPLPKEEYTITSVKKMPEGDFWEFTARIQYGNYDVSLPLPLEVKWAGSTPMITLTDFTIPGMGTFSARVLIYNKKYAGTWRHGKVGGHLFGVIEKVVDDVE